MNDNSFTAIVQTLLQAFRSPGRCPDQFVGEVFVAADAVLNPRSLNSDFAKREDVLSWGRPDAPIVILVLESPHTDEFVGTTGPAKGDTGKNIRTLFGEVCNLRQCLGEGIYPLVLINAIQYQCSLGYATECFRDKVFAEVWNQGGKCDFQSRIKAIFREGDVIINACTAGKKTPQNRVLVENALTELDLVQLIMAKVEHPANWARRRNIALKQQQNPNYGWTVIKSVPKGSKTIVVAR